MTTVGVIIPWYAKESDQWRDLAMEYVQKWWSTNCPFWPLVIGTVGSNEGPWRKSLAVHRGLQQLNTDIIVVADADVICDGVQEAVDQITALRSGWAIPHRLVCRLTADATTLLLQDGQFPPTPGRIGSISPGYAEVYAGAAGGGMTVLPRKLLIDVPLDPRFAGWGQEDYSWARALTMIAGHPWRGRSPLFHLWHTPQERLTRGVGSPESNALWERYQSAANLPIMLDVVEEARMALDEDLSELPPDGLLLPPDEPLPDGGTGI